MNQTVLSQIENRFKELTVSDQLQLIERLVHQVNTNNNKQKQDQYDQLAQMASDPEIQQELKLINEEFSRSEGDGLENI